MYIQEPEILGVFVSDVQASGFWALGGLGPSKIALYLFVLDVHSLRPRQFRLDSILFTTYNALKNLGTCLSCYRKSRY